MAALALAGALLLPAGASAAQFSGQAGGGGGQPFTLTCGDGRALIGIRGRAGDVVDSIRGVCAQLDELGAVTAVSTTAVTGGSGGEYDYELRCPSSQVVTGLRGRAASFLDEVSLVCARMATLDSGAVDPAGRTDGDVAGVVERGRSVARLFASAGEGNGGAPFTLNCPGTLPARGLQGRSAALVDRIGLVCDAVTIAPALPEPPLPLSPAFGGITGLTPAHPAAAQPRRRAGPGRPARPAGRTQGRPLRPRGTPPARGHGRAVERRHRRGAGRRRARAGGGLLPRPPGRLRGHRRQRRRREPADHHRPPRALRDGRAAPRGSLALGLRVQLPPVPAGNRELTARADPGDQFAEPNEANNVSQGTIRVIN